MNPNRMEYVIILRFSLVGQKIAKIFHGQLRFLGLIKKSQKIQRNMLFRS